MQFRLKLGLVRRAHTIIEIKVSILVNLLAAISAHPKLTSVSSISNSSVSGFPISPGLLQQLPLVLLSPSYFNQNDFLKIPIWSSHSPGKISEMTPHQFQGKSKHGPRGCWPSRPACSFSFISILHPSAHQAPVTLKAWSFLMHHQAHAFMH